jgi:dUTP pyrophosphatase
MEIKLSILKNAKDLPLPQYATKQSAGIDLHAAVTENVRVCPGETALVPTGFCMEIPEGYEAQIRPRSGIALKHKVTVLNSPSTIDSDYRGEVMVLLINLGKEEFIIRRGDRIAQLIVAKCEKVSFVESDELSETSRGHGGFGSTGV